MLRKRALGRYAFLRVPSGGSCGPPMGPGVSVHPYALSDFRQMREPRMQKADKFPSRLNLRKSFGGVTGGIELVRFRLFADKLKEPIYGLPTAL